MKFTFAPIFALGLFGTLFLPAHLLVAAGSADASQAEIRFVVTPKEAALGSEVAVDIFLDTKQKAVNALSGEITLSRTAAWSRIHDGDSIIGAWLKRATMNDPTRISFSGIIPGGITTSKGKVMTLYLLPKELGVVLLSLNGTIFENKAPGVPLALQGKSISITVHESSPESSTTPAVVQGDIVPPEKLKAIIAQNNEMFDGKPFIIINARDSESGIATIELLETEEYHAVLSLTNDHSLPWRIVENPAPLLSRVGTSYIYVRATDREGNAAVIEVSHPIQLSPESAFWKYNKLLISAILIIAAGLLFLWLRRRRRTHYA